MVHRHRRLHRFFRFWLLNLALLGPGCAPRRPLADRAAEFDFLLGVVAMTSFFLLSLLWLGLLYVFMIVPSWPLALFMLSPFVALPLYWFWNWISGKPQQRP